MNGLRLLTVVWIRFLFSVCDPIINGYVTRQYNIISMSTTNQPTTTKINSCLCFLLALFYTRSHVLRSHYTMHKRTTKIKALQVIQHQMLIIFEVKQKKGKRSNGTHSNQNRMPGSKIIMGCVFFVFSHLTDHYTLSKWIERKKNKQKILT